MLKVVFLIFAAYVAQTSAQSRPYTSLGWSSCSTAAQVPKVKIERLSILPMPIKHPGSASVDVRALGLQRVQGRLPTQMDIIRTVAGLALPVRCTIANSGGQQFPVGSCTYADACKDVMQDMAGVTAENCPPELADWGIDCNCPFDLPVQTVDGGLTSDIPDLSTTIVSFLASGDFDVKVTVNNALNQHVACFRFLFTVTKA